MKPFKNIIILTTLICIPIDAKRPPKPPKEPKQPLTAEQKQAIIGGAAEVIGGALAIAQNPHNAHNIGNSIANMLHGLINIIVGRISHKKINLDDKEAFDEYCNELYQEIGEEITNIIKAKI
jgi:hypothetical protein